MVITGDLTPTTYKGCHSQPCLGENLMNFFQYGFLAVLIAQPNSSILEFMFEWMVVVIV